MQWTDVNDIAIELEENHHDEDNINLRFTDLREWVIGLEDFDDDPDGCNEAILEAIQAAWIDERED